MIINQLQLAKWQEQLTRMDNASKAIDFYNNIYDTYIDSRLKSIFPNSYKVIKNHLRKFPLVNTITDDISILFKQVPTIKYNSSQNAINIFNTYINNSNLYDILPAINRLTNLVYKIGLMPRIYKDKIIYDILTPDRCWIKQVQDFPTQIEQLFYWNDSSLDSLTAKQINIATRITADTISKVQLDTYGNISKQYDIQQNPYGYIPVVWICVQPIYQTFWPVKLNPLVQINEYYVIAKTYQQFALVYQAIATMITKGLDPKVQIPFGPMTWINLPSNNSITNAQSDAKYITPDANFQSLYAYSEQLQLQATLYAGLSIDAYKKAATYSSGYQLELSKLQVIDYNKQQIRIYTNAFTTLMNMTIDTINLYTQYILPYDTINIDISLPKTYINATQQWQLWQKELEHNIISQLDIMKTRYPNLNQQQIISIYNTNKTVNQFVEQTTISEADPIPV